MAANKRPRKTYIPKPCGLPMTIRQSHSDDNMLKMMGHGELLKLKNGEATDNSWHTIVCRLNLGMRLADMHFVGRDQGIIEKAWVAMREVQNRFDRVGKWGASPGEIQIVHDALILTDDIQDQVTRRELRDAINFVMDNVAIKRTKNVGSKIVETRA